MDLALTVLDGLRQIYGLQDAIRRQRRVNRKTYLRMMEIYVELQTEPLQWNATLQRTNAIEMFTVAVDTFARYLKKYHDMHWHGRIFKQARMEEERVKIVDEIDKLLRMLNLASNVAVINGQAVASTNAARLFAKLEHMHGDIKFTHDQIHAALLADKQQIMLMRTKMIAEPEPVVRQAPILKKYVSVVVETPVVKDDTPREVEKSLMTEMKQIPVGEKKVAIEEKSEVKQTIPENVVEVDQSGITDEEEKSPIPTECELEQDTADVVVGSMLPEVEKIESAELKQSTPENVPEADQSATSGEVEEKTPVTDLNQSTVVGSTLLAVEKMESTELKQSTPENVAEVDQAATSAEVEEKVLADTKSELEQSSTNIVVGPALLKEKKIELVELKQLADGDEAETEESDDEKPALVESTTDEMMSEKEIVDEFPQLEENTSSLDDSSVPLLIQLLGSDQATPQQKEEALLHLLRKCVTNSNRVQVYKTKGIPVLTNLVRNSESFFTQLYALHCLSWFTFSYSKMRESEFVELQHCVRQPTHPEILSLLHELQYEDDNVKEVAGLQCSCMATRGDGDALRRVGVFPPVIDLLKNGTSNQKLWAAETLVTLASDDDDNSEAIMRGGAIPPLVALLRSGTDMQKQEAAYALGNLAANNEVNRAKIAREGAIPPMVAFVKAVTDAQNQWAVYALGFLAVNNEENRVLIAQEGAIPPLVALLRTGTRAQKQWAAYTLGNLAHNDANRVEITQVGAIALLVELLRTGTAMVKQRAAFALGNLACDSDDTTDFDEAILPLVELVRSGSDTQKEDAAYTLGNLASNNNERRAEIGRRGAIPPLVKLLEKGNDEQKQWAAFALRYLAYNNDLNRVAIVKEGAIPALVALMDEGTDDQKEQASHALNHFVAKDETNSQAFIPDRFMTPIMGYLRAGAQNANVTALNTLGTVRERVVPMLHKLVQPDSPTQNQPVATSPADLKAENKLASAW